jgi:hypothetical protein
MELLEVCLRTTYFQVDESFYQQKEGMVMGSSLSPVVSNMEHFEKLAVDMAKYKPARWLHYVDDTFVVWPHDLDTLKEVFSHISSLRPSIQFTMEIESSNIINFLDVLVTRKELALTTKVHRKPTHAGRYLNFAFNHLPHVKRGVMQSLYNRAATICQDQ